MLGSLQGSKISGGDVQSIHVSMKKGVNFPSIVDIASSASPLVGMLVSVVFWYEWKDDKH